MMRPFGDNEGLVKLGLLRGKERELIKAEAYRDFYTHRAGHWLGLDVHDVGEYRVMAAALIGLHGTTIEPGIYIAADIKGTKRWGYEGALRTMSW